MNKELFERMQKNERPYGLLSDEEQECLKKHKKHLEIYDKIGWTYYGRLRRRKNLVYRIKSYYSIYSKITCKSCGVNEPRLPDGWLELDIRPYDVEKPSFEKDLYMCPDCAVKLLGTKGGK